MPLSEQEQRCVAFACHYLEEHYGGSWSIKENLDDLNLSEPTPEVTVSNGKKTAAVEVKRLIGDSIYQSYIASLRHNERRLAPSCGGSYYLCPAVDFRLPMPSNLQRLVKREIGRVAPTLSPGEKGAIRIQRQGHIVLIDKSAPPFISCLHNGPYSEIMNRLSKKVMGKFMLIDAGLEHSFITQECKDAFEEAVVAACKRCLEGNNDPFDWYEEWELIKIDNESGEDGVWIIATTDARSMPESVEQCVHDNLNNAMEKFRGRQWANLNIIVLETFLSSPASLVAQAVENFMPRDRALINHFLIVDGADIKEATTIVSSLAQAAEVDRQHQYQHIIESPVSEARVQRFRDDYLKGRQGIGAMERIFKYFGAFQFRNERNDLASFGFIKLVHKGPFVDGSNWADLRGWEFAVAEERHLLKDLHDNLEESVSNTGQILSNDIIRQPDAILDATKRMADLLGARERSLIILATHLDTETIVSLNKVLTTADWELEDELRTNRILGKHEGCPVLYLNEPDLNNLYIVDVPRFASLVQYTPQADLHVLAIDKAAAERMLEDHPELKLDLNDLLSMVHLTLYQSYEIQIHDQQAIWAAKFSS